MGDRADFEVALSSQGTVKLSVAWRGPRDDAGAKGGDPRQMAPADIGIYRGRASTGGRLRRLPTAAHKRGMHRLASRVPVPHDGGSCATLTEESLSVLASAAYGGRRVETGAGAGAGPAATRPSIARISEEGSRATLLRGSTSSQVEPDSRDQEATLLSTKV